MFTKKYDSGPLKIYISKDKRWYEFGNKKLPFTSKPSKFILGYPTEIFDLIDEGIRILKIWIPSRK